MCFLLLFPLSNAEVVRSDQSCHQKKRSKLHPQQIGLVECDGHLLWTHGSSGKLDLAAVHQKERNFSHQNCGKDRRSNPNSRCEPQPLEANGLYAQIEHHHNKDEEHHNGSCVNDHFESGDKRCAERVKHDRNGKQRDDKIEQRMDRIQAGNRQEGCHNGDRCRDIKHNFHVMAPFQGISP